MGEQTALDELPKRSQQSENIENQFQAVEDALQDSEEIYRRLVDLSPDSVVILQDGLFKFASSVFTRQFGYTQEEIRNGLSFYRMVQKKDREAVRSRYENRLAGVSVPKTFCIDLIAKDGKIIPCETSASLIHHKGRPADLVILRDICERIEAENDLISARKDLECQVEERTDDLRRVNEKLKGEIVKRKDTELALLKREKDLEGKATNLEEVNTALKVLLKRREEDKKKLEEKVLLNVKEMVEPYLKKLQCTKLDERQKTYVSIVESNLEDIISPFVCGVSMHFLSFTPSEIQVAKLVKQGKPTKEIAKILNLSSRTIEFHRDNIRKKIGIKNRKINLRTHLLALQDSE